ncbi:putative ribonuclease H-like domain-containing protein [Tanacetum coccineum]|uniref:Ribonuclease H-like domain-containing protein n=1 Tax=Tanacetum coccineum TaxID=301880 RepID=A0ABQ5EHB2_9ASTR
MRPFGCPVTILNTIDHLGKFDGKADEGFFVGYSTNSKTFRVFNGRTRIVEENMHVQLSENTPNIAGSGPNWLFDIDALTKSMNYKPVVAGNQSNGNVGTKACNDAGKARIETLPRKDYIPLPMWPTDPLFSQNSKDSPDAGFKPSGEEEKKDARDLGNKSEASGKDSEVSSIEEPREDQRVNQELDVSINRTSNINTASNENSTNNVIVWADMNNLDAFMPISPIPTTRIHKDHLVEQIIRDLHSAPQTRRMTKNLEEHDYKMFRLWWDLPNRKRAIRTKWVYKNKKDKRGIVIKNKSRLVAQGCIQEEGIDYDEVFAPVSRIEAIRLFLAMPYVRLCGVLMDVKSAFLYGMIEEEVYLFINLPGFETASTPMETQKPLLKDADDEDVDEHLYRSMIGSLMHLTSSWPDIIFVVCACARFQDSPFFSIGGIILTVDYARARLARKSITGGLSILGCRTDSCKCKKQTVKGIRVNAGDSKLMLLGINLLLLEKVNAARHNLTNVGHKLTTAVVKRYAGVLTLMGAKTTAWNEFSSTMASAIICLATNQKFNFSKYIFDNMVKNVDSMVKFWMYPRFVQVFVNKQVGDMSHHKRIYVTPSHTKKIFRNMKREGKGFSGRVTPLFQTMMVQAHEEIGEGSEIPTDPHHTPIITQPSSSQPQRKQKSRKSKKKNTEVPQPSGSTDNVPDENVPTTSNDPLLSGEDRLKLTELIDLCTNLQKKVLDLEKAKTAQDSEIASLNKKVKKLKRRNKLRTPGLKRLRKGRKITDIDADAEVTLIDETQGRNDDNLMFDTYVLDEQEVKVEKAIKAAKPKVRGVMIQEPSEFTTITTTTTPVASKPSQEKGKAKMIESEKPLKKKDQIMYEQEVALNLQAQLQAKLEEEERLTRQKEEEANIALIESWDNTQAMMDADYQMAQQLQAEEQEQLIIEEKSKLFSDVDGLPWGIHLMPGYESEASEAALQSPKHAPPSPSYAIDSPEYASPSDDNLEPTKAQALPAPVSPAPLSPDYSVDPEPIEDDPQCDNRGFSRLKYMIYESW